MVTGPPASAAVIASIAWKPDGPLPRRLEPVHVSSIAREGPELERAASSRVRTHPDGSLDVIGAPDESGESTALRVDGRGPGTPARIGPDPGTPVGWRLIDAIGHGDGSWTLLELVPGRADSVRLRRVEPAGATAWESTSTAGSPGAVERILGEDRGSVLTLAGNAVISFDQSGVGEVAHRLSRSGAHQFMNGVGQIGFVDLDLDAQTRMWVTVDLGTGAETEVRLRPREAWRLDVPLGMDARGRPYGTTPEAIVRFDGDGHVDWELEAKDAIVDGEGVIWVARAGEALSALPLSAGSGEPVTIAPGSAPGVWRLAGRTDGAFVLHRGTPAGTGELARVAADGRVEAITPAPDDVWTSWFDAQLPRAPAVTDSGDVDLVTRGPDALYVIRITPGR